jgi:uncharacterized RDD family membrane protein YckC
MRRYAGIVSRGIAFTLDATVAIFVYTVGFQFVRLVLAAAGVDIDIDRGAAVVFGLTLPAVLLTYCAAFWSLIGRTPGMFLLGVRVVTADGGDPGIGRSIIRALGYLVSAILLLGFAWIAVDRRRQGFHDKLAGTFVIYDFLPHRVEAPTEVQVMRRPIDPV